MRAALSGDSIGYSVQAPVEELRAMEQSATVAGRRLLLVGGEAAALLFAFAVLAARSMRRDLEAARRRLTWYGARRWQLRLLTVTESAIVAVAGALIGWLVGVVVGALAASRAGAPVGAVLRESVLSPAGLAIAAGVVVLATLVVAVATSMPARAESRFGLLDVAAVGSIALVIAALLGGAADQSRLAESQNAGLVLLLLPGPDRVCRRCRRGTSLRPARPVGRPAAPPQRRRASRGRDARPRARARPPSPSPSSRSRSRWRCSPRGIAPRSSRPRAIRRRSPFRSTSSFARI